MKYLIDTDWVIDQLHGVDKVVRKLDELAPEGLSISVVTLAELYEGVLSSTDPASNERALLKLLAWFPILGIDENIARLFGEERGRIRSIGKQREIGDLDIFIAATCLNFNLTLLTHNLKHFSLFHRLKVMDG